MAYWLVKSEPDSWSWDDHWKKKGRVERWNGVRNHQAANNMKAMQLGDRAFFYHSNTDRAIVGIVEVVKLYYPDPSDETGRFGMVDFKAIEPLKHPVTLAQVKATAKLSDMVLVKNSRLSVQPVTAEQWKLILKMSQSE